MLSCIDVAKFVASYLRICEVEEGLTQKTLRGKREALGRLLKFLDGAELSLDSFRGYIASLREKGWMPSSISSDGKVIKRFVTYLFEERLLDENFGLRVKFPKIRKDELEIVPFDKAQEIIEAGCSYLKTDNKLIKRQRQEARDCLVFALKSGLRNAELRGLLAGDFNLEEKIFSVVGKGGTRKRLPIANDMIELLRPRVERGGLMFRVGEKALQIAMERGCRKLGVTQHIRVHSLRHIYATTLLKSKVPYGEARRLLRHTDTRILDTVYAHYDISDLSNSLNGSKVVPGGLSVEDKLNRIKKLLLDELGNDSRFVVSTETDSQTSLGFGIIVK